MRYLTEVKALVLEVSLIFTKSMNVNNQLPVFKGCFFNSLSENWCIATSILQKLMLGYVWFSEDFKWF